MIYKLSIITINLNNKGGLQKTIESIVNQTFRNIEFIIIDGNSTDGSVELIKQYDAKITKWISEIDTGVYHAMNKGIRMSEGEYLLFLNSGDRLVDENVLSNIFNATQDMDFLCGKANIWINEKIIHITEPPIFHTFKTYFNTTINHQATFIKKSLFEKYGYYKEELKLNSDVEFWIRTIILNNCSTKKLDIVVVDYYLGGISSKKENEHLSLQELKEIYSHPILTRFVPDYEKCYRERLEMKMYRWIKSKRWLDSLLRALYNLTTLLHSKL